MPKDKSTFFCQGCGYESPKWMGFCPSCGEHSPLVEAPRANGKGYRAWLTQSTQQLHELSLVSQNDQKRIPLAFEELNRVLGGGVVPGSIVLLAGEPGIGKSTLLLQTAQSLTSTGRKVLYVTGEESVHQIKLRSDRLGFSGQGVYLLTETNVDDVIQQLESFRPDLAVVDSIQTLYSPDATSGPGSVAQVRECALKLMQWAKSRAVPVIMAGHVTKDGTVAGPRVLEHIVDVVLYIEGENLNAYRVLRSEKNRFGSTNELGIFQMESNGLQEVQDPSRVMLAQRQEEAVGSAIVPVLEGSRPLLVEVQALTSHSVLAVPRRIANGVDYNRLLMIIAVLSRRVGLSLSNQDIIVNVVSGLRIHEPATDVAIALAIASSLRNSPVSPGTVALGEVGLSGELRSVPQLQRRLNEAVRLGFAQCLLPESAKEACESIAGIRAMFASTLGQALRMCLARKKIDQTADQLAELIEEHV